jgi:hypothetical protein
MHANGEAFAAVHQVNGDSFKHFITDALCWGSVETRSGTPRPLLAAVLSYSVPVRGVVIEAKPVSCQAHGSYWPQDGKLRSGTGMAVSRLPWLRR